MRSRNEHKHGELRMPTEVPTADSAVGVIEGHRSQLYRATVGRQRVSIGLIRICGSVETVDIFGCIEIIVERIQIAQSFGLHIGDNAGVDEGEPFILSKECLGRCQCVGSQ